jgi:hypothetical protein
MDWKQQLIENFKGRISFTGYYPISFEDYITEIIGDKPLWQYKGFGHMRPDGVSDE